MPDLACYLAAFFLLLYYAQATLQIVPGATLTAGNTGKHVQAHGAGVTKVGDTYYMVGEDKSSGGTFQNVNCYASTNLAEWNFTGAVLSRTAAGDLGPNRVVERPKVIYNRSTKKYVLYMHVDSSDYKEAKVGVSTCDSVCGKYTYRGSFQPMGHQSRDMGLFQDDDGTAYLLSEDRANGLRIYKLSSDYLSVQSNVYTWKEKFEAPAMLKRNGAYFMFGSHLSGWSPNDNIYSTASSISGPWSPWTEFAPKNTKTYNSQTTYILPLSKDLVIYMGDRWTEKMLMRSTYVWLPLRIEGRKATLSNYDHWSIDAAAGTWKPGPQESTYAADAATLLSGAKVLSCAGCSGGKVAGYIGGPSNGSVLFPNISSLGGGRKTIRIFYANGDKAQRFAGLSVNGGPPTRVAFLPSNDGATPGVSAITIELKNGANSIKIGGLDGGWGPDLDRLVIPQS